MAWFLVPRGLAGGGVFPAAAFARMRTGTVVVSRGRVRSQTTKQRRGWLMKINELLARLFSRGVSGRVRLVVGLLGVVPLGALAAVNAAPSFDLPRIYSTNEVRA